MGMGHCDVQLFFFCAWTKKSRNVKRYDDGVCSFPNLNITASRVDSHPCCNVVLAPLPTTGQVWPIVGDRMDPFGNRSMHAAGSTRRARAQPNAADKIGIRQAVDESGRADAQELLPAMQGLESFHQQI